MVIKSRIFATIISLFVFLTISSVNVFAEVNSPNFPSCVNPQGSIKANYPSGTHGVPGVVTLYKGLDIVYSVSENVVVQCLCPENGDGVQTNWWKIPQLTADEIENFKTQGWIFVPEGSAWGLDPAAYLAKNSNFACRSTGGSSSSSGSSNNNSIGGASSLGDILALAATGNIKTIYALIFTGFISLLIGYLLNRRNV